LFRLDHVAGLAIRVHPVPMTRDKAYQLAVIVVLQLVGILAGDQLGKIAPLADWYQREVGCSLSWSADSHR
jgi:hypothetical protein